MVKNWMSEVTVRHVGRTTSTQDEVRAAALAGAEPGYCCVADEQTEGRGRAGRAWTAPPGSSLLASILVRVTPASAPIVPLLAGVAAADAVRRLTGVEARLKWPNDVMVGGRKLAGILCEMLPQDMPSTLPVVVGIGMNLTVSSFPEDMNGVSLHQLAAPVARDRMLSRWTGAMSRWLSALRNQGAAAVLDEWRRHAVGLGSRVSVNLGTTTLSGIAEDVDEDGALLLRTEQGVERVLAGDVHVVPTS